MYYLKRLFTTADVKGTEKYLDTQKKYELIRTLLYFGISASLFIGGYLQTKSKVNLLTIVAVLGCLPASKSAVNTIMFFRFKSCKPENAAEIKAHSEGLLTLFDCIFTSYSKTYRVSHLAVRGRTVCGFTEDPNFDEAEFNKHITDILKLDGHKDVTVKIFTSLSRYTERLEQMKALEENETASTAIIETLKSVIL